MKKQLLKTGILILSIFLFNACAINENVENDQLETLTFTGQTVGCSDFIVAKLLDDDNENITLSIIGLGREDLNLTATETMFNLPVSNLTIQVSEWDQSAANYFCSDTIDPNNYPQRITIWSAVSGTAKVLVTNVIVGTVWTDYKIAIVLEDVIIKNGNGTQKRITDLTIINLPVGWLPG